ncbi:hypothetical protein FRC19_011756, partial [Serendipita sp. 401]
MYSFIPPRTSKYVTPSAFNPLAPTHECFTLAIRNSSPSLPSLILIHYDVLYPAQLSVTIPTGEYSIAYGDVIKVSSGLKYALVNCRSPST